MPSSFEDFDDDRPARRSRSEAGHGGSSFWTMFGGSMGCLAAVGLLVFLMCAGCGGCLMLGKLNQRDQQQQRTR